MILKNGLPWQCKAPQYTQGTSGDLDAEYAAQAKELAATKKNRHQLFD